MGERSPKRQRLGSYSPASPPLLETKGFVGLPPSTPPPSVRMSPSWQSQASLHQQSTQHVSSVNMPTPPSTAGFHSHMTGRTASSEGDVSGRATPIPGADTADADIDTQMDEAIARTKRTMSDDAEMGDAKRRRTDHEQEGDAHIADAGSVMATEEESTQVTRVMSDDAETGDAKRRRTDHDREGKGEGEGRGGAENTRPQNVGLLKLENAMTPTQPSRPHPSDNLIHMYSLQSIQASVARRDPVTGEKINKLRKSYETKVKSLNLAGRNKAVANQGELGGLVDPGWDMLVEGGLTLFKNHHQSKELGNPTVENDMLSKLNSALKWDSAAQLPRKEDDTWANMLGLDANAKPVAAPGPTAAAAIAKTAPAVARSSTPNSPRNAVRPERAGKKRRYDESSYDGYDGYAEDGQPLKQRVRV